ncbi:gustatory receptor for bitter taste 66a-like [Photinus pyralis]|nr:gustatory receptor for bitter taste 66a-like [Photinus pyralis]
MKIATEKTDYSILLKKTILQLMHQTLSVSACKIFAIDFRMLYGIGATVVNYLVIMLQFDLMADKLSDLKTASLSTADSSVTSPLNEKIQQPK